MKKTYSINFAQIVLFLALIASSVQTSHAQINPFASQLFNNTYIANPSLSGTDESLKLDLNHKNQWSNFPGSPKMLRVNADQRFGRVGLAVGIQNNKEGDLKQTSFFGAVAYHIPLNDQQSSLNFGLRLSGEDANFDINNAVADPNDPSLTLYNERQMQYDTDFGFAFMSKKFDVEFAVNNIAKQLDKTDKEYADFSTGYFAAAYHFNWSNWALDSKVAYRAIRNYTDIMDIGMRATAPGEKLSFTGMYHTSSAATLGISYLHDKKLEVSAYFHTPTAKINYAANGNFELGLSYRMRKSK